MRFYVLQLSCSNIKQISFPNYRFLAFPLCIKNAVIALSLPLLYCLTVCYRVRYVNSQYTSTYPRLRDTKYYAGRAI